MAPVQRPAAPPPPASAPAAAAPYTGAAPDESCGGAETEKLNAEIGLRDEAAAKEGAAAEEPRAKRQLEKKSE